MRAASAAAGATPWAAVVCAYLAGIAAAAQLGRLTPRLGEIQEAVGVGLSAAGLLVSLVTLVGAVGGIVAGALVARLGEARAIVGGLWLTAAGIAAAAAAPAFAGLAGSRAVEGIGYLLVVVAAPSLMANVASDADRPRVMALWSTFIPVGLTLAGAIDLLAPDALSWRGLFLVHAALVAMTALAAGLGLRGVRRPGEAQEESLSFGRVSRAGLLLAGGFSGFAAILLAVASLYPAYAAAQGAERAVAAIVVGFAAAGAPGSLATGAAIARGVDRGRLLALGLGGATLALACAALVGASPAGLLAVGVAAGAALGVVPATVFGAIREVARDAVEVVRINALIAQLGCLGSLAGPPLVGLVVDRAGWTAGLVGVAGLSVATLTTLIAALRAGARA
ncbi:MFS transporter [Salinarimonas sp. NSM]|uniref:MFS transporter n=1 Tax=Salinarimonas sp. NSM TaxID=3458003 RepID=UPI0040352C95